MPARSPESIAAAYQRSGGHPKPPRRLGKREAALWRAIVETQPADFFGPGECELLASFCTLSVAIEKVEAAVASDPLDGDAVAILTKLSSTRATAARQLRIAKPSAARMSEAKTAEASIPTFGRDTLLGGHAVVDIETRRRG